MTVILNWIEIAELDRQNPSTKANGGFQSLLVTLQQMVDRATGRLPLDVTELERISRYAFKYRNGGWQGRLMRIFRRTLGPSLGAASERAA